ncbi:MAG TPA: hypothetical protein VGM40_12145 [Mycobacterium sp.]|jgi:hypothetical protein
MDVASLSPEPGARAAAARSSTGTLERPARRSRAVPARAKPQQFGQGPSPAATVEVDPGATAPDDADHQQADYFLHLLAGRRRLIDHRVDEYQKAIVAAEANRDVEAACNFRRMVRLEIQDRQTVDGMIEKLRRRFIRQAGGEAATAPPRKRFAVR